MYLEQENGKYYFRGENKTVWKADENISTLTVKLYKENRKYLETPVELLNGEYLYIGDVIEITCAAASHYTPDVRVNGQAVALSSNKTYVVIDGATTITAEAVPDEYTVTLEANDGTIAEGKEITAYTYGVGAVLPTEDDITKENYLFSGWYAASDFSSEEITEIGTTDTGDKTFYAKWTAQEYTVTLEANDGVITDGKDVTSYTYGVGATLPTSDDITKESSTFDGWYADAEFMGDAVTAISATDTGDKVFYAKWTEE